MTKKFGPEPGAPTPPPPTPEERARYKREFLELLRTTCNVSTSSQLIGFSRRTLYNWRNDDPEFAEDWDEAVDDAIDALELEARRRAMAGVEKPIMYKGEEVARVREYSDRLMEFLLTAHRPEKYRQRLSAELTGRGGGPIKTITTDMTAKEAAEAYAATLEPDE